jgi:hypothetical protein
MAPAGTPDAVLDALDVAQKLASALGSHDWATARAIDSARRALSDQQFQEQYGDLKKSTAVLVRWTPHGGTAYQLRLGLVAHQASPEGPRTQIFCVDWQVAPHAPSVTQLPNARTLGNKRDGWVEPRELVGQIRSGC